ncbi:MAG: SPASM domain-containing protein, partial [candidate division WOR-3 bacterium]
RLTGLAGTYTRTINGIECLREVGIPVHTNTTVTRENLAYLEEIVRLVKGLGLNRLSMNLLIPCGSASERKEIWVSYSEIGEHILRAQGLARALGIKFLWYSPVPLCKFNPIAHCLGNKSCAAVSGLLSIDPEGNILPCSSWPQPLGSLLKEPFQKIWNSVGAEYFKEHQYAPDICQGCELFPVCIGACPIYWQHRGADELKATVIDDGV